ncbi:MAG: rhamnogalacturonan acetylesterase [Rudaea sp.]
MRRFVCSATFAAAMLAACAQTPRQPQTLRVLLVGDSTMARVTGYGDALCARLDAGVTCANLARGGRSSKSYRDEGLWGEVLERLREPGFSATYVLIQFGHNDQPGKTGRSTTLPEFGANLQRFVREARERGAVPVLVTPLTRRVFKSGRLVDGLAPWADAARGVARETRTTLLDLHADSMRAVQAMGAANAILLAEIAPQPALVEAAREGTTIEKPASFAPQSSKHVPAFDYTHLGPEGASVFSKIVGNEIREELPALAHRVAQK